MNHRAFRTAALALAALTLLAAPSFAQVSETIVVEAPEKSSDGTRVFVVEEKDGVMFVQAPEKDEELRKEIKVVTSGKPQTWLGVGIQEFDEDMMEALDIEKGVEGVLINEIYEGSPAEAAGLMKGDIILTFDGEKATDIKKLVGMVRDSDPGDTVEVTVLRENSEMMLMATLGEREAEDMVWVSPDLAEVGVELLDMLADMRVNIPEIELGMAGFARRGKLGVYVEDLSGGLAEYFEVPDNKGVLVEDIVEDGPADKAGIKPGDVIIRIGDDRVVDTASLVRAVAKTESGEPTRVEIVRKGRRMELAATIEHPEIDREALRHKLLMMEGSTDPEARAFILQNLNEKERGLLEEELEQLREELQELKKELSKLKSDE